MEKFRYKVFLGKRGDGDDVVISSAVRTVLTPELNNAVDIEINDLSRAVGLPVDEESADEYLDWASCPFYLLSRSDFTEDNVEDVFQAYCNIAGIARGSTISAYRMKQTEKESDA